MPSRRRSPTRPRRGALAALAALGAANAAWAGFLWQQLRVARAGGEAFCALGGAGCEVLWDGAFARAVQSWTGVPVAGWGVAWGLAALALPLVARRRAGRGGRSEPAWSATVVVAAAGMAAVAGLAAVSLSAGSLCGDCLITYAGVAAYAGLVGAEGLRARPARPAGGAGLAAGAAAVAFLLVLVPGLRTPPPDGAMGSAAVPDAGDAAAWSRGERQLREALDRLSPPERQALADARATWLVSRAPRDLEPRALRGPADAPVVLTVFTDSSCPHCARFHEGLERLLATAPDGSIAVDSRVFPLDGSCNPHVGVTGHPERCLAARVRLCLEDDPRAPDLEEGLFARMGDLSEPAVWGVATRFAPEDELRTCVDAEATDARLAEDIRLAMATGARGTPHLLLNGRPTLPNLAFVYAMAVTGADARHPVFEALPAPSAARRPERRRGRG